MKNSDKILISVLILSCLLITLIIRENIYLTNKESNEIMPLTATTLPQEDKTTEAMKNKLKMLELFRMKQNIGKK